MSDDEHEVLKELNEDDGGIKKAANGKGDDIKKDKL